nr:hypothetical protein [Tanacetum cinerariifolium]
MKIQAGIQVSRQSVLRRQLQLWRRFGRLHLIVFVLVRNIQNQRDMNDALRYKKKAVVVHSDPLALVAEKTNVSKRKEKVVVSLDSEGSGSANNNLRTSSTSQSSNKKHEFVKSDDKKEDKKADEKKRDMSKVKCYNSKNKGHLAKDCKKAKVKDYNYYKTKMLLAKKDSDEQVLLA